MVNKSYLGAEIKQQLFKNYNSDDKSKSELAKNTLEKYWYSDRYAPPNDNTYYFIGKKKGCKNYVLERDEVKSPNLQY